MELLGNVVHVEYRFSLFGDNVSVGARKVPDRCMVCAKHTISSNIFLDALDGTPR